MKRIAQFLILMTGILAFPDRHFAQEAIPVEIVPNTDDMVGQALVYKIREELRRSSGYRITTSNEPRVKMIINTMDRFPDSPNVSTIYSVVWVLQDQKGSAIFWDTTLGFAGRDVVDSSATTIVATLDNLFGNLPE